MVATETYGDAYTHPRISAAMMTQNSFTCRNERGVVENEGATKGVTDGCYPARDNADRKKCFLRRQEASPRTEAGPDKRPIWTLNATRSSQYSKA